MARERKADKERQRQERMRKAKAATESHVSAADREERLRIMAHDAARRDRLLEAQAQKKAMEAATEAMMDKQNGIVNPTFLQDMHQAAYVHSSESMEERLARNKHYIQRKADSGNFMRR